MHGYKRNAGKTSKQKNIDKKMVTEGLLVPKGLQSARDILRDEQLRFNLFNGIPYVDMRNVTINPYDYINKLPDTKDDQTLNERSLRQSSVKQADGGRKLLHSDIEPDTRRSLRKTPTKTTYTESTDEVKTLKAKPVMVKKRRFSRILAKDDDSSDDDAARRSSRQTPVKQADGGRKLSRSSPRKSLIQVQLDESVPPAKSASDTRRTPRKTPTETKIKTKGNTESDDEDTPAKTTTNTRNTKKAVEQDLGDQITSSSRLSKRTKRLIEDDKETEPIRKKRYEIRSKVQKVNSKKNEEEEQSEPRTLARRTTRRKLGKFVNNEVIELSSDEDLDQAETEQRVNRKTRGKIVKGSKKKFAQEESEDENKTKEQETSTPARRTPQRQTKKSHSNVTKDSDNENEEDEPEIEGTCSDDDKNEGESAKGTKKSVQEQSEDGTEEATIPTETTPIHEIEIKEEEGEDSAGIEDISSVDDKDQAESEKQDKVKQQVTKTTAKRMSKLQNKNLSINADKDSDNENQVEGNADYEDISSDDGRGRSGKQQMPKTPPRKTPKRQNKKADSNTDVVSEDAGIEDISSDDDESRAESEKQDNKKSVEENSKDANTDKDKEEETISNNLNKVDDSDKESQEEKITEKENSDDDVTVQEDSETEDVSSNKPVHEHSEVAPSSIDVTNDVEASKDTNEPPAEQVSEKPITETKVVENTDNEKKSDDSNNAADNNKSDDSENAATNNKSKDSEVEEQLIVESSESVIDDVVPSAQEDEDGPFTNEELIDILSGEVTESQSTNCTLNTSATMSQEEKIEASKKITDETHKLVRNLSGESSQLQASEADTTLNGKATTEESNDEKENIESNPASDSETEKSRKRKSRASPFFKIRFSKKFKFSEYHCDSCNKVFAKNVDLQMHCLNHIDKRNLSVRVFRAILPSRYDTSDADIEKYLKPKKKKPVKEVDVDIVKNLIGKYCADETYLEPFDSIIEGDVSMNQTGNLSQTEVEIHSEENEKQSTNVEESTDCESQEVIDEAGQNTVELDESQIEKIAIDDEIGCEEVCVSSDSRDSAEDVADDVSIQSEVVEVPQTKENANVSAELLLEHEVEKVSEIEENSAECESQASKASEEPNADEISEHSIPETTELCLANEEIVHIDDVDTVEEVIYSCDDDLGESGKRKMNAEDSCEKDEHTPKKQKIDAPTTSTNANSKEESPKLANVSNTTDDFQSCVDIASPSRDTQLLIQIDDDAEDCEVVDFDIPKSTLSAISPSKCSDISETESSEYMLKLTNLDKQLERIVKNQKLSETETTHKNMDTTLTTDGQSESNDETDVIYQIDDDDEEEVEKVSTSVLDDTSQDTCSKVV